MIFFQKKRKVSLTAGFTLMEVMVAIAIMGILSAFIVPNILGWRVKYSLKAAARNLYSSMQTAKGNAAKVSNEWAVVFDTAANSYSMCFDSGDGDWTTTADNDCSTATSLDAYGHGLIFQNPDGGANVSYLALDDGNKAAVFNADGSSNSGFVTLVNNTPESGYKVSTTLAGIILMEIWTGGGWE
jgi:prepilin-type N-terminal cleavage/methylation domain-containing protein